jgi:hypothetical protein
VGRATLVRLLFLIVACAPVVRATCDVSCIRVPAPAPAPCHGHDGSSDDRPDRCSHDHAQLVARLSASPALDAAVLPAIVLPAIVPSLVTAHTVREDGTLASRASPLTILRI